MFHATSAKLIVVGLFGGGLLLSLATHGSGVIANDPDSNIWIPDELTMPLQLQVAYNDDDILFRYRWPTERPHLVMDVLRYDGEQWVRHGASPVGPEPDGMYEDRVSMLVDDGSVPEFQRYGGYITVGDRMRFFTGAVGRDEIAEHPVFGPEGHADIRKYLPETRTDKNDWASLIESEDLAARRESGYFLDLWHWRSHRSNPLDISDDQFVADYRRSDAGRGAYFTNWDGDARQPVLMFNPEQVGFHALRWEEVTRPDLDPDSIYYLSEEIAAPFDSNHAWQEGDVIPRRALREPAGSRATITVDGAARWQDGAWDVILRRALDTGAPLDDKIMHHGGVYDIGVAVHRDATGARWHYVSMPYQVGLGRAADIRAYRFSGTDPAWDEVPVFEMTLFYPGQVSWPRLTGATHAGADNIRRGVPVRFRHNEAQLAQYGVEIEFEEAIRRQWMLTLVLGIGLIGSFALSASLLLGRRNREA